MSTNVQTETLRQFNALAPRSIVLEGKTYNRDALTLTEGEDTIRPSFSARKARGAFLADKVAVTIRFDAGADLYQVAIVHADGVTFETRCVASLTGATWEAFGDLASIVASVGR